jgi:hypothetical protein
MKNYYFFWFLKATILINLFLPLQALSDLSEKIQNYELGQFIENKGQWDSHALFLAKQKGQLIWLTETGFVFDYFATQKAGTLDLRPISMRVEDDTKAMIYYTQLWQMRLKNSQRPDEISKFSRSDYYQNYFLGSDPDKWASNVGLYQSVTLKNVYPGIDEHVKFSDANLEYDFIIAPGSSPEQIELEFLGANSIELKNNNTILELSFENWIVEQKNIYCYQDIDGNRVYVDCSFFRKSSNSVGFSVGNYNRNYPLIIDPVLFSTFLGGSGNEYMSAYVPTGLTTDISLNIYLTGSTLSTNFPLTPGSYDSTYNGDSIIIVNNNPFPTIYWRFGDAFVTKINSAGNALVYSTYIGGKSNDKGSDIAVDASGYAYICGATCSNNFPTKTGSYDLVYNGSGAWGTDAFVTKLDTNGTNLIYSTYLGALDDEDALAICVDGLNCAYVAGYTESSDFPTTSNAYMQTSSNYSNGFVCKLNDSGSNLLYSTYFQSNGYDEIHGMAINGANKVYLTGSVYNFYGINNFPLPNGSISPVPVASDKNAFVAVLDLSLPNSQQLVYSTCFGGAGSDVGEKIRIDPLGRIYFAGSTTSGINFPYTSNAFDTTYNGGLSDGFFALIDPNAQGMSSLIYSSFFGGSNIDSVRNMVLDMSGYVYLAGYTNSTNLPTTASAYQASNQGAYDCFFSALSPIGYGAGDLLFSTYFGGSNDDFATGMAIDWLNHVYISGITNSTNYPILQAIQQANAGQYDYFVTKATVSSSIYTTFTCPDTVCVGESFEINNTTSCAISYNWGFCEADLEALPIAQTISGSGTLSTPSFIEIVNDNGNYYSFVSNANNTIVRNNFGLNLMNTPISTTLPVNPGELPEPLYGLKIKKILGNWIGLAVGGSSGTEKVVLLDFGNSISNNPTYTTISGITGLNKPKGLIFESEGSYLIAIIANSGDNTLLRLSFSTIGSLTSPAVTNLGSLGNISSPNGISSFYMNGNWYIFVTNSTTNTISRIIFPFSLLNPTPIAQELTGISSLNVPTSISLFKTCSEYFAFVVNRGNSTLTRLKFPVNFSSTPVSMSLGNLGLLSNPYCISNMFMLHDTVFSIITNSTNSLIRTLFPACQSAIIEGYTINGNPIIHYNSHGEYTITLVANEGLQTQGSACKTVVVVANPTPSIQGLNSVCRKDTVIYTTPSSSDNTNSWTITNGTVISTTANSIKVLWNNAGAGIVKLVQKNAGNCSDSIQINVTINGLPNAVISGDNDACVNIESVYYTTPESNIQYLWEPTNGTIVGPNNKDTVIVKWNSSGNGFLKLTKRNNTTQCCDSTVYFVQVNLPPQISMDDEAVVCYGSKYKITPTITQGTQPLTYSWTPTTGLDNPSIAHPYASPATTTTYTLTVTDNNGCSSTDNIKISINPEIILDIGADTTICQGSSVVLGKHATGETPPYTYLWTPIASLDNPTSPNPSASPMSTATYTVRVTDNKGCVVTDNVTVNVVAPPKLNAGADMVICPDSIATLNGKVADGIGYTFSWEPPDGLSNPNVLNPEIHISEPGTYTYTLVAINNTFGCLYTDDLKVRIRSTPMLTSSVQGLFNIGTVGKCDISKDSSFNLLNPGTEDILIQSITETNGFDVISPAVPFTIPAGSGIKVTVRFSSPSVGETNGFILFSGTPCSISYSMDVKGEKLSSDIITSATSINYGTNSLCSSISVDSVFTIHNNGTEPTAFLFSSAECESPFTLISPTMDTILNENESIEVRVNFSSNADFNGSKELQIPYQSGACPESVLLINLSAITKTVDLAVLDKEITIPAMLGCDNTYDTVIVLRNRGTAPITITNIPFSNELSVEETLPLTIEPGNDVELKVKVTPQNNGDYSSKLYFEYEPCNLVDSMEISGVKQSVLFATNNYYDLGEFLACRDTALIIPITIRNKSAAGVYGKIINFVSPGKPFEINIKEGDSIAADSANVYYITFKPDSSLPVNEYLSSMQITLEPCDTVININLRAAKGSVNLFNGSTVDFGMVINGRTETQVITVANNGTTPMTIDSIDSFKYPFDTVSCYPPLPAFLNIGDSIKIIVSYTATIVGEQTDEIRFLSTTPCNYSMNVGLRGECLPVFVAKTSIKLHSDSASTGEEVNLPIILEHSENLRYSGISSYQATVRYNPSVLEPRDYPWTKVDEFGVIQLSGVWNPVDTVGTIVNLWFNVALGDQECSNIELSDFKWLGGLSENQYSPGKFCIKNLCKDGGTRLLNPYGIIDIGDIAPQPVYMPVNVDVELAEGGFTQVYVINSLGEKSLVLYEGYPPSGKSTFMLDASKLAAGAYLIVLETPTVVKTKKFQIIK